MEWIFSLPPFSLSIICSTHSDNKPNFFAISSPPPLPFPPSLSHSQLTAGDGHFSLVRTRAAHCTNWIGVVAPQEVTFMTIAMNLVKKDGAISLTIATPISRE